MGIEPTLSAWEAEVLPLNYTRKIYRIFYAIFPAGQLSLNIQAIVQYAPTIAHKKILSHLTFCCI
jgi:hypothetical protein